MDTVGWFYYQGQEVGVGDCVLVSPFGRRSYKTEILFIQGKEGKVVSINVADDRGRGKVLTVPVGRFVPLFPEDNSSFYFSEEAEAS